MKFKTLQENLRKTLRQRIHDRELTGLGLAGQIGFQQAHISNFLNRKRGLSLEAMDRVLKVQHLSVLDLLDPDEINKRASIVLQEKDGFESILLVDGRVAVAEPLIMNMNVNEVLKFKRAFLRGLRTDCDAQRAHWERFVLIKADAREAMGMYPRLLPGATVLIDRHYTSLKPYRRSEANMYALNYRGDCALRYVELSGDQFILRPNNPAYPVIVLPIEKGKRASDYVVGRICYVGIET